MYECYVIYKDIQVNLQSKLIAFVFTQETKPSFLCGISLYIHSSKL